MIITFEIDENLDPKEFKDLFKTVYDIELSERRLRGAIRSTVNICARGDKLVGCLRFLTDGYLGTTDK